MSAQGLSFYLLQTLPSQQPRRCLPRRITQQHPAGLHPVTARSQAPPHILRIAALPCLKSTPTHSARGRQPRRRRRSKAHRLQRTTPLLAAPGALCAGPSSRNPERSQHTSAPGSPDKRAPGHTGLTLHPAPAPARNDSVQAPGKHRSQHPNQKSARYDQYGPYQDPRRQAALQ